MAKPTKVTKKINPLLADEKPAKKVVAPVVESNDEEQEEEEEEEADEVVTPKKVAASKAPVKENADNSLLSDIKITENKLNKEPKVMFMVPLAEGEKKGAVHECFINGFRYAVPKGVMTQIPESIASLLAEHYKIGMEAGADFRIDNDNAKLEALG